MKLSTDSILRKKSKREGNYHTPPDRIKQANKVYRAHLKYGKDSLKSSDIDNIPGLEILHEK
tara:strand:+ start:964 stop:1149 length:186 start_codon:yes stop_codon:yes gene_type:complete